MFDEHEQAQAIRRVRIARAPYLYSRGPRKGNNTQTTELKPASQSAHRSGRFDSETQAVGFALNQRTTAI